MGGSKSKPEVSTQTQLTFDVNKFLGAWFEMSRIDNPLESSCANAIAQYTRAWGGELLVTNTCYSQDRKPIFSKTGKIRVPDVTVPSKFEIKFDGWTDFQWAEYWVYDTDYTNYALVGNSKGYFWILSRQPRMTYCDHGVILDKAKALNFDVSKLKVDFNVLTECPPGWTAGYATPSAPTKPPLPKR